MITNALLNLGYWIIEVLSFPIRIFDDVVLPADFADAIADAGVAFDLISTVFPVSSMLAITAIFITIETAILLWNGVNWLIRKIPTIN